MSDALEVTLLKLETIANGEVKLIFAVQKDDAHKTQHLLGKVGHPFGLALARINYQATGKASVPASPADVTQEASTPGVIGTQDSSAENCGGIPPVYERGSASPPPELDAMPATNRQTPAATSTAPQGTNRLAQHIAILCNDVRFQRFIAERFNMNSIYSTADKTAEWVRKQCGVQSRAEILPGTKAEQAWNLIESAYLAETH